MRARKRPKGRSARAIGTVTMSSLLNLLFNGLKASTGKYQRRRHTRACFSRWYSDTRTAKKISRVGAACKVKVSPDWSQKTITCHSFNCFSIVWGQG